MKKSTKDPSNPKSITNNLDHSESKKGSGPKTTAGKRRVRLNALTHGFYSCELVVREEDAAEFDAMKKGIRTQLKPTTELEQLGIERVLSWAWRHKLALRMEARRLKPQLDPEAQQEPGNAVDGKPEPLRWYTAGRRDLNAAGKMLLELRQQISTDGGLHLEEQKDSIVKVFGSDFYDSLAQWRPTNTVAILAAESMAKHAEKFKMPLPSTLAPVEALKPPIVDERARWDMMLKVVDLKLQQFGEFIHLLDQPSADTGSEQALALDAVTRYVASTGRELERAVEWYLSLREHGLITLISSPANSSVKSVRGLRLHYISLIYSYSNIILLVNIDIKL